MKCYVLLICLVSVCVKAKECIYIDGMCSEPCPDGTYGYAIGCDYVDPEPTCNVPNPKKDLRGMICDFSACYCEPPTVRDEVSKNCVPLKECPVNSVTPRAPVTPREPVTPKEPVTPREPVTPKELVTPKEYINLTEPVTPMEPVNLTEPVTSRASYIRIG